MERVAFGVKHLLSLKQCGREHSVSVCASIPSFAKCKMLHDLYYTVVKHLQNFGPCELCAGLHMVLEQLLGMCQRAKFGFMRSQIIKRDWVPLPRLNVMAGVIHLETPKIFREKLTVCLL